MLAQPFVSALSTANRFRMQTSHFIVNQTKNKRSFEIFWTDASKFVMLYCHESLSVYFLSAHLYSTSILWHSIDCQFLFNILSIKFNHSNMSICTILLATMIHSLKTFGLVYFEREKSGWMATFADCSCGYLFFLQCSMTFSMIIYDIQISKYSQFHKIG